MGYNIWRAKQVKDGPIEYAKTKQEAIKKVKEHNKNEEDKDWVWAEQ